jgi:hypothetical protein
MYKYGKQTLNVASISMGMCGFAVESDHRGCMSRECGGGMAGALRPGLPRLRQSALRRRVLSMRADLSFINSRNLKEQKEREVTTLVYNIPVFGWALREAAQGPAATKLLFIVNLLACWLLAIPAFGYPAIIIPALTAVPAMFVALILITWDR